MPTVSAEELRRHNNYLTALTTERSQWELLWRELSDNYLPQRYRWLLTAKEYTARRARRQYIINNTGTQAARTLAAGMMNGVTSPSRPWFKLRVPGLKLADHRDLSIWLEEVERRLLQIMAESNFYNSMAVMYLDMSVFGTAANLIYEDPESVIRCYNPPLGEFFVASNDRGYIDIFARRFMMKVHQYVRKWPNKEYWSEFVKNCVQGGEGGGMNKDIEIAHFVAPNLNGMIASRFRYYEMYWEPRRHANSDGSGVVLEKRGFHEMPGIFARWEVSGTDPYGVSPGMDALGDVIELQHLHRQKAELLEKMNNPPVLADISLQNNPVGMMPKGVTYVSNLGNNAGVKPLFDSRPDFAQITLDKQGIEERIRNTFFNFLFTGITDLTTVRSASEIDAREGEKLTLLGGVLERFESEALDPGIKRTFSIARRAGLIPPIPEPYRDLPLEIQYVSILSVAQRAVGTAPVERYLGLLGNLAALKPEVMELPDLDNMLINYGRDIGVRESELRDLREVLAERAQKEQQAQLAAMAEAAPGLAQAGKNLSETEVGAGGSALDKLLGG